MTDNWRGEDDELECVPTHVLTTEPTFGTTVLQMTDNRKWTVIQLNHEIAGRCTFTAALATPSLRKSIKICRVPRCCRSLKAHKSSTDDSHFYQNGEKIKRGRQKCGLSRFRGEEESLILKTALASSLLLCHPVSLSSDYSFSKR